MDIEINRERMEHMKEKNDEVVECVHGVEIDIDSVKVVQEFYVKRELASDVVLGMPWVAKTRCGFKWQNEKYCYKGSMMKNDDQRDESVNVRCVKSELMGNGDNNIGHMKKKKRTNIPMDESCDEASIIGCCYNNRDRYEKNKQRAFDHHQQSSEIRSADGMRNVDIYDGKKNIDVNNGDRAADGKVNEPETHHESVIGKERNKPIIFVSEFSSIEVPVIKNVGRICNLERFNEKGISGKKDKHEVFAFCQISSKTENSSEMFQIGNCCWHGIKNKKDGQKAFIHCQSFDEINCSDKTHDHEYEE
ncbi:hypothetical protein F8M41_000510 [Gigaspora margarita]|uniref:Uncharacterized protein n=1 Tax=Gigaspora margarita TaxID=4874 RepID=A0A8H3XHV3_GIGMA|nr:hypothetical protein F8M41_000510 [Gigaspora margarita]